MPCALLRHARVRPTETSSEVTDIGFQYGDILGGPKYDSYSMPGS